VDSLLERHVRASEALALAARDNATAQARLARALGDGETGRKVVDEMWTAFRALYASFQEAERVWNELAPSIAGE
jgi:hypothetical protein